MLARLIDDTQFYRTMLRLSTPIVIQNLITFSLGAVDMVMIGQLGDDPVAAVGLADQIFFLLILMQFGIASGAGIFAAQYWGKRDIAGIHRVLGLGLILGAIGSCLLTIAAVFAPEWVLSIYTTDPEVIALGSDYLRIVGVSYTATAITVAYTFVLRSIENVRLPMIVGAIALALNTLFNYLLIFGMFGFPRLEVEGAAIATAGARTLEAIILLGVIYLGKSPLAASPRELFAIRLNFLPTYFKFTAPVLVTEVAWSLGITTYSIIYARISTEAIAAINIVVTIERIAFVAFLAMASACAIMIGNSIGANNTLKAYSYAKRFLILGLVGSVPVSLTIFLSSDLIMSFYNVSETVSTYAIYVLTFMAFVLPIKITTLMVFIGILRSGGDTQFSMIVDAGFIWLVGVPLAFFAAFVLGLPVYWVYLWLLQKRSAS